MDCPDTETDMDDIKRTKEAQLWFAPAVNFTYQSLLDKNAFFFIQVLPLPENIEVVILRHPGEYFAFLFSLEQCALIYFQYGNIVTKEAQPWFAPTGEIFNFVLSYLFKNGPISD